jgi:hypothetical protein
METTMSVATAALPSKARLWTGRILTGLLVLFLAFDGVAKIAQLAPVLKASEELGLPANTIVGIGSVLLVCTVLYALPRTAVLGAILLTAYLGGATAINVRAGAGAFPVGFAIGFGVLVWVALALREPRVMQTVLWRS